jgi:hypothetical protein
MRGPPAATCVTILAMDALAMDEGRGVRHTGAPETTDAADFDGRAAGAYATSVRLARRLDASGAAPVSVALGGSINTDLLVPALRVRAARSGFDLTVHGTPFGGWVTDALDRIDVDVWVVWFAAMGLTRGGTRAAAIDVDGIAASFRRIE